MATLGTAEKNIILRLILRYYSRLREDMAITVDVWKTAITNTDQWIEDNQTSYNQALPVAAQNGLVPAQKTLLFCAVAVARVSIAALRRMMG